MYHPLLTCQPGRYDPRPPQHEGRARACVSCTSMVKFFVDPGAAAKLAVRAYWLCRPLRCVKLCAGVPATCCRRSASCVPPSGGFTTCG